MDAVRARGSWLAVLALVAACALAIRSRPSGPALRSRPEEGLAQPSSPWPSVRHGLVGVWVVIERGVDGFVDQFLDRPVEDRRSMRQRLDDLRAQNRVLERRLAELKREAAERDRRRCGQWYRPNPYATSALDVMRGQ
jgi:hypothetical protein